MKKTALPSSPPARKCRPPGSATACSAPLLGRRQTLLGLLALGIAAPLAALCRMALIFLQPP